MNSSNLSGYGKNILGNEYMDQNTVYKKQQKPFDIINFNPASRQTALKHFPRLTLEDKIIYR